jgi:P-type E1-E2 ATPase
VEEGSSHLLGRSIVAAARVANDGLPIATHVSEAPGRGVGGTVSGREVLVGSRSFVIDRGDVDATQLAVLEQHNGQGALRAFVVIDGEPVGAIDFADTVRPNVSSTFNRLRHTGVERTLLLSGDHPQYVRAVADAVGISEARGDLLPADKASVVAQLEHAGEYVLMVGDGVNDAPALSRASVGVALAAHGRGVASESADVILLEDDLSAVAEALEIGHRTMGVARQSILAGLGLSGIAMVFAAAGYIPPVIGAALQEAIDVAVILNALRTSY